MKINTILALDLGTTTGWAYRDHLGRVTAGSWRLQTEEARKVAAKSRLDRRLDPRVVNLYRFIESLWNRNKWDGPSNPVDFLVYEDVQFSRYTLQTQLWASLRGAVWLFASFHRIHTDCCPVTTLKKFATGSGAADKDFMVAAAMKAFPELTIVDDNAADALHLLRWATSITNRTTK